MAIAIGRKGEAKSKAFSLQRAHRSQSGWQELMDLHQRSHPIASPLNIPRKPPVAKGSIAVFCNILPQDTSGIHKNPHKEVAGCSHPRLRPETSGKEGNPV
jgi:hypothetical protein